MAQSVGYMFTQLFRINIKLDAQTRLLTNGRDHLQASLVAAEINQLSMATMLADIMPTEYAIKSI